MNKAILLKANQIIRKRRPSFEENEICGVFHNNDLLEIGFLSKQCQNDAAGCCIMCDYGAATGTHDFDIYIFKMQQILAKYKGKFKRLLLCTNGSFLDEYQIPSSLLVSILEEVNKHNINEIEIETHYQSVTASKLELIKRICPNQNITIELGLETINEKLHEYVIMKHITIPEFKKNIFEIQHRGFNVDVNIMVGMPFLNSAEQLTDALNTIKWSFDNGCNVILFPVNIKPFTLLWHMYHHDFYESISHWLMISLLNEIPVSFLNRITIVWFGNREETYDNESERTIFPSSCITCEPKLMSFYPAFNKERDAIKRKELLNQLCATPSCDCNKQNQISLQSPRKTSFETEYQRYINILINEFNI